MLLLINIYIQNFTLFFSLNKISIIYINNKHDFNELLPQLFIETVEKTEIYLKQMFYLICLSLNTFYMVIINITVHFLVFFLLYFNFFQLNSKKNVVFLSLFFWGLQHSYSLLNSLPSQANQQLHCHALPIPQFCRILPFVVAIKEETTTLIHSTHKLQK